jgi:hypothetical protein
MRLFEIERIGCAPVTMEENLDDEIAKEGKRDLRVGFVG